MYKEIKIRSANMISSNHPHPGGENKKWPKKKKGKKGKLHYSGFKFRNFFLDYDVVKLKMWKKV